MDTNRYTDKRTVISFACQFLFQCMNGEEFLAIKNASRLTSDVLHDVCPYILYQVQNNLCDDVRISKGKSHPVGVRSTEKPSADKGNC